VNRPPFFRILCGIGVIGRQMGPSRNRMPNGRVITRPIVGILIVMCN
jgi:hypothetical protein